MAARVLIIGLNYSPEHTGIAPYTAGMARALREEGCRELADIGPVNEVAMSEYDRLRRRAPPPARS